MLLQSVTGKRVGWEKGWSHPKSCLSPRDSRQKGVLGFVQKRIQNQPIVRWKKAYSGRKQTLDVGHLRRQEWPHAVGVVSFHACRHAQWLSHVPLSRTPRTVACQAPLPMEFCRRQYWSGLPIPSPGDLPALVIELASPALASGFSTSEPPRKPNYEYIRTQIALICKVSTLSSGPPVDSRVELEKS